jgi:polysaccharide export outer membrane protein
VVDYQERHQPRHKRQHRRCDACASSKVGPPRLMIRLGTAACTETRPAPQVKRVLRSRRGSPPDRWIAFGGQPTIGVRLRDVLTTTAAVCGIAALSACSQAPPPPPPPDASASSSLERYRIQVGDVLGVRLLLNPDLNEDVVVRPDGHMSTTVVRDELARGRTVPELAAALTHDYTSIVRNPRLTVVLRTFSPTRFYVGGEVAKPGESVTAGLNPTLSQAIVRAGGLKGEGKDRVYVIRRGPDDVPQLFSARLRDVMREHDPAADVEVAPYDVVYVPRGGEADVHRYLNEYLVQLVPVIWGFSYNVSNGPVTTPVP